MKLTALFSALPGSVAQGLIWGILAIGVYVTYKILDFADLTVDGTLGTGGAVAVVLIINGVPVPLALVCAGYPRNSFGYPYTAGALLH